MDDNIEELEKRFRDKLISTSIRELVKIEIEHYRALKKELDDDELINKLHFTWLLAIHIVNGNKEE